MTTYTRTPSSTDPAGVDPQVQQAHRRRVSPLLLGLLVLAAVALVAWWAMQRYDATPVADTTPVLIEPPAADEGTAASVRDSRATGERPAPAAIADRAARPLAGNPLPEYPRTALRNGQAGSVLLSISLDARGIPTDVQVIQRNGDRSREFDRAAIEAARQWRFDPAVRNGEAVPSTVQLPVDFRRD